MTAAAIAAAFGDSRREGRAWRCRCPLHGGYSLVISDGDNGCLLVTCWSGCNRLDVLAELRRRGLLLRHGDSRERVIVAPGRADDAVRTARALKIWHNSRPCAGTVVETYLRSRGIELDQWPTSLRFHGRCPRPSDEAGNFLPPLPAMVALVEHVGRGPVAVHCTYLAPHGAGKADLPPKQQKACFGPVAGGAARFGMPCEGKWLGVAEGIETALSVAMACAMPTWAALSAGGIRALILPPDATHVIIAADHDASGTGERAAGDAAARWLVEARRVRIARPSEVGADFNDVLTGGVAAKIKKVAGHVA